MQILNELLDHVGINGTRQFEERDVLDDGLDDNVYANSASMKPATAAELSTMAQLRTFYDKQMADLHGLLQHFGLDGQMEGVDHYLNLHN